MKKSRVLKPLILLFLLGCTSTTTGIKDGGVQQDQVESDGAMSVERFSLLTYNVAGLPEGLSGSKPESFIPLISPLLNEYDLVLVQEDFWYHALLIEDLEHPHQSPPMWEVPELTEMGDGLNRFSIFPFDPLVRTQWVQCHGHLDCSNDCLATKGFSVARTDLGGGALVDVYNLHMEAGGCPEDIVSRTAGVAQLLEAIKANSSDVALIVAGDFNLREGDPTELPLIEQLLEEGGLTDACMSLDCGDLRIDKVMFRSSEKLQLSAESWRIPGHFVSLDGHPLSDHEPVEVVFQWKQY